MSADQYTDEEVLLLREQLRRGNAEARKVARERGIKLHPKIAKLRTQSANVDSKP